MIYNKSALSVLVFKVVMRFILVLALEIPQHITGWSAKRLCVCFVKKAVNGGPV